MDDEEWLWWKIGPLRSSFGMPASSRGGARPDSAARRNPKSEGELARARERTRRSGAAAGGEREEPAAGTEGCGGGTGARDFARGGEEDGARWTAAARSGLGLGERNIAEPL
jgi:hypothetical protein